MYSLKWEDRYSAGKFSFSSISTDIYAEEAVLSRLSYTAYLRADEARMRVAGKLSVRQIVKTAAFFSLVVS